jgi:hypothetical protein
VDSSRAKLVGQKIGIKSTLVGILIAYLIMSGILMIDSSYLDALLWFTKIEYWINLLVGAIAFILSGYFYGRLAGFLILIKKKDYELTGIIIGFLTLWTGTLLGSTIGFIQEGLDNFGTYDNPIVDYYFKPLFWITFFGFIPVIVTGLWFGKKIKKAGSTLKMPTANTV